MITRNHTSQAQILMSFHFLKLPIFVVPFTSPVAAAINGPCTANGFPVVCISTANYGNITKRYLILNLYAQTTRWIFNAAPNLHVPEAQEYVCVKTNVRIMI